ncbi:creatinine amidohydrolase [Comamonas odontotermitis]|uniref:Creatinine amidohydrolase n=1 Tax=Comamonas odontotermitis TaxID=379895 RepID=A0ABR6RCG6_9BURK|nr:creatininase family protein [Comamonas odontotermitis]MBB6576833.1 creatinine amidohydrolase [Comamonas odontotermitis]
MSTVNWSSRWWKDISTREFTDSEAVGLAARTVAVLPVAAIEQHGPHLPVSVDATLLKGIVDAAMPLLPADVPVLVLPAQNVGLSTEHLSFPGTLSLPPRLIIDLWTAMGQAVARAGIRKLLMFNTHGGQVAVMDIVARELRMAHGMLVYSSSWGGLPLPAAVTGLFSADEHRFGIHGGEIETSMMLHLAPAQVRMEHAGCFHSTSQDRARRFPILGNGKSAKMGWAIEDYNACGAVGNAAGATAEKGKAVVDAAAQQLALLLQEIHQLDWRVTQPPR